MTPAPESKALAHSGSALTSGLIVLGLWGVAVAQPLLDLLGRTTAFFVAHQADRLDLLLFAAAWTLAAPIAAAILVAAVRLASPSAGRLLEIGLWAGLGALIAAHWIRAWPLPAPLAGALALAAGALAARALATHPMARTFGRWLGLAVWIIPLLFLVASPARKIDEGPESSDARAQEPHDTATRSAVLVVFDEFPLVSLLDESELIDGGRFPNFAALASTSTWYRNATTVAQSTAYAVPAILSGRYPAPRKVLQPVWVDYKTNLFTALGRRANLHVVETMSRLCPRTLCSGQAHIVPRRVRVERMVRDATAVYLHLVTPLGWSPHLPVIGESWRDFWSPSEEASDGSANKEYDQDAAEVFDRFLEDLAAFPSPALHYVHLMTPHLPWDRLPDGTRYATRQRMPHGLVNQFWRGSEWEVLQARQRHLLQVGWVDTLVGRLRRELEDLGQWEDTIVVVTSDHGTAFRSGGRRRNLTRENFAEIVNVPLFVKYPGQTSGSVDDSNVETIDITPTLLAALGAPVPTRLRGVDLAGPERRSGKTIYYSGLRGSSSGRAEAFDLDRLNERRPIIARNSEAFGSGSWEGVYAAGPFGRLIGSPIEELPGGEKPPSRPVVRLDQLADLAAVDLDLGPLPLQISGGAGEANDSEPMILAVAVNGVVRATTETYLQGGRWQFTALLPKSALVGGQNALEILSVSGTEAAPQVRRLHQATPQGEDRAQR